VPRPIRLGVLEVVRRVPEVLVLQEPPDQLRPRVLQVAVLVGRRGRSIRDLIRISVAASSRNSPARSSPRSSTPSIAFRNCVVIRAMGISKMSMSCSRIRWSRRSSGPSNWSRATMNGGSSPGRTPWS
jgi:hypothetical protein